MEKCNVVKDGLTPCRVCEGGHSEYVCPRCRGTKVAESSETRLDVEKLSEDHDEHKC